MCSFLFTQAFSFVNMSKKITRSVFLPWLEKSSLKLETIHVIHPQCILCKSNVKKLKGKYTGKLVTDVVSYGENGASHMLRPNFEPHFSSAGHTKCTEIATGVTVIEGQKPLSASFGNSIKGGINVITPLLRIALYIARKDLPVLPAIQCKSYFFANMF